MKNYVKKRKRKKKTKYEMLNMRLLYPTLVWMEVSFNAYGCVTLKFAFMQMVNAIKYMSISKGENSMIITYGECVFFIHILI